MEPRSALVKELRDTLGRLESALGLISDALVITSADGLIKWCNAPFTQLIHLPKIHAIGKNIYDIAPKDLRGESIFPNGISTASRRAEDKARIAVISNAPLQAVETTVNAIETDEAGSLIICIRDVSSILSYRSLLEKTELMKQRVSKITETNRRLKQTEKKLSQQICECPVTGLPNRRGLIRYLEKLSHNVSLSEQLIALFFCDLNGFKQINDTHGHQAGDELLIEISARLAAALRPQDFVSRLGGDEFVAVSNGLGSIEEALLIASRLHQEVGQQWAMDTATIKPHMSIGIATSKLAELEPHEMIRKADLAMYEAKSRGRSQTQLYSENADIKQKQSLYRINLLRHRIESQDVAIVFQPIFNLEDRSLYGYEALTRLHDDNGALLPTLEMISLAESIQMISALGNASLRKIVAALPTIHAHHQCYISINASPLEIADEDYAKRLLEKLEEHNISPHLIHIEVTESTLISNLRSTSSTLSILRNEGAKIYLDDFGTGYSSLSLLSDLPSDGIKIDQSFVSQLGIDSSKTLVVNTVLSLCRELGLSVIAEGIENTLQLEMLRAFNCPLGQGYLLGKPVPMIAPS